MKQKLLSFILITLATFSLSAREFTYKYLGQSLNYNILDESEKTCEVAKNGNISGSVIIPSVANGYSVIRIGERAFEFSDLTSITIPNSVITIGYRAFLNCNCSKLNAIDVDVNNPAYATIDGVLYNKNQTSIIQYPIGKTEQSFKIPSSVTTIGANAFAYSSGLTSVTIPNSVTTIGSSAFRDCSSLTSVTIPNSITTIKENTFKNCILTSVTIPISVTTIGQSAFDGCSGLTSVTIPNSVTTIGNYAFYGCSSLTSVTIPNSVTTIGGSAFADCIGLTSVSISNSVTTIGERTFNLCSKLTAINVEGGNPAYASIDGVLYDKDITSLIRYPGGKTAQRFEIPATVKTIEADAFSECRGLTSVTIPNSVTAIGSYAFAVCENLRSITIPNSVTTIGSSVFWICRGLTSVTIPNSVTTIGDQAFGGCRSLISVTIPNSVTTIGTRAFRNCSSLEKIYYGAIDPIEAPEDVFSDYDKPMLYVNASAMDRIRSTVPWSLFKKVETYDSSAVDGITADSSAINYAADYEVYNLNGLKVSENLNSLTPGLYIVRQGTKVKKVMVR